MRVSARHSRSRAQPPVLLREFLRTLVVDCPPWARRLGLVPAHSLPAAREDESLPDRCAAAAARRHFGWPLVLGCACWWPMSRASTSRPTVTCSNAKTSWAVSACELPTVRGDGISPRFPSGVVISTGSMKSAPGSMARAEPEPRTGKSPIRNDANDPWFHSRFPKPNREGGLSLIGRKGRRVRDNAPYQGCRRLRSPNNQLLSFIFFLVRVHSRPFAVPLNHP